MRAVMRRAFDAIDAEGSRETSEVHIYPDSAGYTYSQAVDVLSIFYRRWTESNRRPEDEPVAVDASTGRRVFTYTEAMSGELLAGTLASMVGRAASARRVAARLVAGGD